jgi:hypothetical protein
MYQEPGLAWLQRQAEAAEQLLAERQAEGHRECLGVVLAISLFPLPTG